MRAHRILAYDQSKNKTRLFRVSPVSLVVVFFCSIVLAMRTHFSTFLLPSPPFPSVQQDTPHETQRGENMKDCQWVI